MKQLRKIITFARRVLLVLALLLCAMSLVSGWTFGTPMNADMSEKYHVIASANCTFFYVDRHPLGPNPPAEVWKLEFPPPGRFGRFSWATLGFRYISQSHSPELKAAAAAQGATTQGFPAYSVLAFAIPYWVIIAVLGAPDLRLFIRWLRHRAVADVAISEALPPGTILEIDLPCVHCGYNLKMQLSNGRCPECGALIDDTLMLNKELEKSRPGWLRRLAISNALLAIVRVLMLGIWGLAFGQERQLVAICAMVAGVLYIAGVWLLTQPEHPHIRSVGGLRRKIQCVAAIVIFVLTVVGIWLQADWRASAMRRAMLGSFLDTDWHGGALAAWMFAWLLLGTMTVVEYRFLASLAGRLLDRFMTEHCKIAGIGACVAGMLIMPFAPAVMIDSSFVVSPVAYVVFLLFSVAWLLFVSWCGFMNVYSAVRFTKQSWRAQKRWQQTSAAVAA